MEEVDLLIVGGGINGAGIARDAAGRGLSVMLVEKDDLAAHTSSASSKLIHGGLRYLEQLEFRLVRESLAERGRLLRAAPHIVRPLQFVIPVTKEARPPWMIRAGLFLYDRLGGRGPLPGSRPARLGPESIGEGLRPFIRRGFTYWDCAVQDSRLVVLNALDAAEHGATILTRTELIEARRERGRWTARLRASGDDRSVSARALVNAAGAWAGELYERLPGVGRRGGIRLVKGSHIVLPRLYAGAHAFLLQNADRRVVFAIPFEERFTLVGTTDVDWDREAGQPQISEAETDYLLATVRRHFTADVSPREIAWSYSGLRALVDDGARDASRVTRDYRLELDAGGAPLLSVFGGKITTYRRLAERAVDRLSPHLSATAGAWTETAVLPGGEIPDLDLERYAHALAGRFPTLPSGLVARLARTYGTRTERLLDGVRSAGDLGEHLGSALYAREVDYLVSQEWARSAEDVLWRRTKLGLIADLATVRRLTAYLGR